MKIIKLSKLTIFHIIKISILITILMTFFFLGISKVAIIAILFFFVSLMFNFQWWWSILLSIIILIFSYSVVPKGQQDVLEKAIKNGLYFFASGVALATIDFARYLYKKIINEKVSFKETVIKNPFYYFVKIYSYLKAIETIDLLKGFIIIIVFLAALFIFHFTIFDGLVWGYLIACFIYAIDSRYSFFAALGLLVLTAVLSTARSDASSEIAAVYAYYFLCIGTITAIAELVKDKKTNS